MKWRWFLPGYLWALPLTLIGLVLAVVYRAHSFRWHEGVLVCIGGRKDGETRIWGKPGAQTHGWLAIFASEEQWYRVDLRIHEYTHTKQSFVGGILYGLAYVVLFLWYWIGSGFGDWKAAYHRNPFEKQAYASVLPSWGGTEPEHPES